MAEFGRLEPVPVRTGWADEARDFTPWLAQNLDRLGEQLGLALELRAREHTVGRYALDILADDAAGRVVIIENQLAPSDHTHLGQLLTYCAGTGAKVVVWVAPSFTDEHVAALEWLNTNTVADVAFFAVEVHLLRIGDSPFAPQFTPIVRPNEWVKATRPAVARGEWDWQSYVSDLRVPQERVALGRSVLEALVAVAEQRQLPWQPKFNKGYVAMQRAGGYNVFIVDVAANRPVRLAVKLPQPPAELGLVNPYPALENWWLDSWREWNWHLEPSSWPIDLAPLFEIACRYNSAQQSST